MGSEAFGACIAGAKCLVSEQVGKVKASLRYIEMQTMKKQYELREVARIETSNASLRLAPAGSGKRPRQR